MACGSVLALSSCTKKTASQPTLRVFSWSEYLKEDIIREFETESGARVQLDYFSDNEEMLAKVQATVQSGGAGYDLILPSDYMVRNMIELGLLKKIDKSQLQFLDNFDARFLQPDYDPNLDYCVPFAWGTTGVAVNRKLAPDIDPSKLSWKDLIENPKYAGRATLLNDVKESVQAALLTQGKHLSMARAEDIERAFGYLKAHKKNIKLLTTETRPVIENSECALCQVYSGDATSIAQDKSEIVYIIPVEGATVWTDNFAIPVNGKNDALAYRFLNKLLSAEGAKRFSETTFYPTPNTKGTAMLSEQLKALSAITPPESVQNKLYFIHERPELTQLIDRLWTEYKSQ